MSYDIIKSASIQHGHLFITSASNNVTPRYYQRYVAGKADMDTLTEFGRGLFLGSCQFLPGCHCDLRKIYDMVAYESGIKDPAHAWRELPASNTWDDDKAMATEFGKRFAETVIRQKVRK